MQLYNFHDAGKFSPIRVSFKVTCSFRPIKSMRKLPSTNHSSRTPRLNPVPRRAHNSVAKVCSHCFVTVQRIKLC